MRVFSFSSQQQNRRYPSTTKIKSRMTPHTRLGRSIIINMPMAIQNSAKPHTFFILLLPGILLIYSMRSIRLLFRCVSYFRNSDRMDYKIPFQSCSSPSESRISITSSSVIFSSFPEVNLSTTSGIISRILVIVS